MRATKRVFLLGAAALLLGCPATTGQGGGAPAGGGGGEGEATEPALTSEQLEEIERTVRVGEESLTSCYEEEMERQGKKLTGKVLVNLMIGADGSAQQVEVGETNIPSAPFTSCVVQAVRSWEFPRLPKATPYSFPYAFSPAY